MTFLPDRPVKARTFAAVSSRRRFADNAATVLVTLSVVLALIPLVWVLCSVVAKGFQMLTSSVWWTHSQAGMTAFVAGGGAYHALVGTLLQGLVCAVISTPIGIGVAIFLVEYGGDSLLGRLTTFAVDILTGVPSIVAALFIYAFCVSMLGL
ncbi:MAG: phosphate ABC transporter, permease protein PstA, partial [Mycobacterium sp.]|nr:phosphate ABC transporter, permease protein PstA [Mycobacterium sp.]